MRCAGTTEREREATSWSCGDSDKNRAEDQVRLVVELASTRGVLPEDQEAEAEVLRVSYIGLIYYKGLSN